MRIIKAITLAAIFGFSAAQASACSCSTASNVDDQAASYELIFVGTPIQSVSLTPPPDQPKRSIWQRLQFWKPAPPVIALTPISGLQATEFRIKDMLKGPDSETVTIHHMSGNGANCGINFPNTSQEQLLLASLSKDGEYHTSGCAYPQFSVAEFQAALAAPATPIPSEDRSGDTVNASNDLADVFGTWGVDEAQCSLPQEVSGAPFILTESRFDQHEAHCDTSFTAADPDGWTMSMACSVEGDLQTFTEWVDIADGKLLRRFDLDGEAKEFIRCSG